LRGKLKRRKSVTVYYWRYSSDDCERRDQQISFPTVSAVLQWQL